MTAREFETALARNGWSKPGFMGYVTLRGEPETQVSIRNAGENRRAQIAYLHKEQVRVDRERDKS